MDIQQKIDFDRIRHAIEYIDENFREQPSLNEVAAHVNLSPYHFQRMFTRWSGVSPKQFVQYMSVEYAKRILRESTTPAMKIRVRLRWVKPEYSKVSEKGRTAPCILKGWVK